jgi:hypothetical protein
MVEGSERETAREEGNSTRAVRRRSIDGNIVLVFLLPIEWLRFERIRSR